jgi:hypothetical protein
MMDATSGKAPTFVHGGQWVIAFLPDEWTLIAADAFNKAPARVQSAIKRAKALPPSTVVHGVGPLPMTCYLVHGYNNHPQIRGAA